MTEQVMRIGECLLDPGSHRLTRDDATVYIEPKDYSVLLHLIDAAPDVVKTSKLMHHCWGDSIVGDNSLHQVVRRLRKALRDDAKRPSYIQTLPKTGYRFIAPVAPVASARSPKPRIAVLPFTDYSPDGANAHIVDPLCFEICKLLSEKQLEVFVPAPEGSQQTTAQDTSICERADCVLSGGLLNEAGMARVNAQLQEARTCRVLWSASYDLSHRPSLRSHLEVAARIAREAPALTGPAPCGQGDSRGTESAPGLHATEQRAHAIM